MLSVIQGSTLVTRCLSSAFGVGIHPTEGSIWVKCMLIFTITQYTPDIDVSATDTRHEQEEKDVYIHIRITFC